MSEAPVVMKTMWFVNVANHVFECHLCEQHESTADKTKWWIPKRREYATEGRDLFENVETAYAVVETQVLHKKEQLEDFRVRSRQTMVQNTPPGDRGKYDL